jgi:DNA-binding transcriptional LysR family regulator
VNATIDSNLNDIRVFHAIVEDGSFTAAGKVLDLPTSTISRRISRLENHLGVRLLQRTTRRLSLTDVGRIYWQRTKDALKALNEAHLAVVDMQAAPRGP